MNFEENLKGVVTCYVHCDKHIIVSRVFLFGLFSYRKNIISFIRRDFYLGGKRLYLYSYNGIIL